MFFLYLVGTSEFWLSVLDAHSIMLSAWEAFYMDGIRRSYDHCWHSSKADHLPYGAVHTNQALSLWFLEAKNW